MIFDPGVLPASFFLDGSQGHLLVTQTYISPQATIDPLTSRVASAAGRLGSNGVLGDHIRYR